MSATTKTTLLADQLPIVPETRPATPLVQCGVLYLGTAPPSVDLHGLDSIQEPFSHRYPVDGTNTVRGIDGVLSVYENGIQLTFTRQSRVAIFFPLNSLIYCASVRFSIIENEQTKLTSTVDWRFMPLDTLVFHDNKHPPLFCAVIKRTQILPGNECHCFITKSTDAALSLVRIISQMYANVKPDIKCSKSPIFYQLDSFGRRLKVITDVVYLSPANDDDSKLNRTNLNRLTNEFTTRSYLLDPSLNGYFYRTNANLIEQWQLWDNDDLIGSRPHPPPSPFGLHEGLYHDDTSHEIERYLLHMEDEDQSCACNYSSKSSSSSSSISTEYSHQQSQHHSSREKSPQSDDTDQINLLFSDFETSTFEPISTQNYFERKKPPIIIEKVLPKPVSSIPILNPILPQQSSTSFQEVNINYIPQSDFSSIPYRINERGEKITEDGNRIIFMDVVRPTINKNPNDLQPYTSYTSRPRSHRKRTSKKQLPVYDVDKIQRLFDETKSQKQQHATSNTDDKSNNDSNNIKHLTASDMLEILDGYFEDPHGQKTKLNNHELQAMLDHFESSNQSKEQHQSSIISSINSSKSRGHHRRSISKLTTGSSTNNETNPSITSVSQMQPIPIIKHTSPTLPVFDCSKVNEYIANIYGTLQSIKSTSPSIGQQESKSSSSSVDKQETLSSSSPIGQQAIKISDRTAVYNAAYVSGFGYTRNGTNSNLIQEYRNAY